MAIETNGSGLGAIVGISPSFIEFSLAGTSSVNVTTGSGNDSVEVDETDCAAAWRKVWNDVTSPAGGALTSTGVP